VPDTDPQGSGEPGTIPDASPPAAPRRRRAAKRAAGPPEPAFSAPSEPTTAPEPAAPPATAPTTAPLFQPPEPDAAPAPRRRRRAAASGTDESVGSTQQAEPSGAADQQAEPSGAADLPGDQRQPAQPAAEGAAEPGEGDGGDQGARRRRRRGGRGRRKGGDGADAGQAGTDGEAAPAEPGMGGSPPSEGAEKGSESGGAQEAEPGEGEPAEGEAGTSRRRRRRRRKGDGEGEARSDEPADTVVRVRERRSSDEITATRGSTRVEAKKQRRRDGRDAGRRRPTIMSESEFLARREAVERVLVVRQRGTREAPLTQIAVLEDGVLVEHYVDQGSQRSIIGNIYLGKVQNVLPAMEAAFVDIGRGRNAVLYAGEVDWSRLEGKPKRIEEALQSGQSVLVQVSKDPIGHKGARLTSSISLPGRFVVYVPGGSMSGVSRKLSDTERSRLRTILKDVVPDDAEVIIRTAAEGAGEEELRRDVARLRAQWEDIEKKVAAGNPPVALYTEPDLTLKIVRDLFNEDFSALVISGEDAWDTLEPYVAHVAPSLVDRLQRWDAAADVFDHYRVDEQIAKALERKVWLPSGGSLVIDRTEAMTVVDVNTGKFTGGSGNLEETVTKNNLEAAEEVARQLRLRDIGGIIVVDFIDMVLESNRDLVVRRLVECLARDRTRHQVAEVTSLGLVQMTRKRIGTGLLETFSSPCECCHGRGLTVHAEPVPVKEAAPDRAAQRRTRSGTGTRKKAASKPPDAAGEESPSDSAVPMPAPAPAD
jgi:ribonuclease E